MKFPSCRSHWLPSEDAVSRLWLGESRDREEAVTANAISYRAAVPASHRTIAFRSSVTSAKLLFEMELNLKTIIYVFQIYEYGFPKVISILTFTP